MKGLRMPNNDQLTKNERLRLESFNMAIQSSFTIKTKNNERPMLDDLFKHAKQIEEFLKASNPN